jgi:uncharacterized SAM-binding protein YcdF (DUF218 family)
MNCTSSGRHYSQRGGAISTLVSLLFLIALCAAVYLARHPIMRFAAESWIVNEPATKADAIVVLSDDNFYADRATHAAELYRQGAAPVVVASGRKLRPSAGITELMVHDLGERGVPKESIVPLAHDAENTREEAVVVARFAADHHWKKLIIVTSNYHTRRARYIFQKVAPAGMETSVASARDGDFDPELWWEKRKSSKEFMGELLGMLVAMWELRSVNQSGTALVPTSP